jgi:hypothetical protein
VRISVPYAQDVIPCATCWVAASADDLERAPILAAQLTFETNYERAALVTMPKRKTVIGPMKIQPAASGSSVATLMKSSIGEQETGVKSARTEAVRAVKAKLSRRNSLKMQREAMKGQTAG